MTEDEAKTKWCPMVREPMAGMGEIMPVANRNTDGSKDGVFGRCIASDCMMWREVETVETTISDTWQISAPPNGWRYVVSFDDGTAKFERAMSDAPKSGYCGLAGKS